MATTPISLAVIGQPLAPKVVAITGQWLHKLGKNNVTVIACDGAGQGPFQAIAYLSSPQGTAAAILQQVFTQDLTPGGRAVIPVAREDAWVLAAFLKAQDVPCLTYGLGNAELVLTPQRRTSGGIDVTLKYSSLNSRFTLTLDDEAELVVLAASLALLVAGGIDLLDLLPLLTPTDA